MRVLFFAFQFLSTNKSKNTSDNLLMKHTLIFKQYQNYFWFFYFVSDILGDDFINNRHILSFPRISHSIHYCLHHSSLPLLPFLSFFSHSLYYCLHHSSLPCLYYRLHHSSLPCLYYRLHHNSISFLSFFPFVLFFPFHPAHIRPYI